MLNPHHLVAKELYERLFNLSDDSLDNTISIIQSSENLKTPDGLEMLARAINFCFIYRPLTHDHLIKICLKLALTDDFSQLQTKLLQIMSIDFLYLAFRNNYISLQDAIIRIRLKKNCDSLFWFGPEIEIVDPALFSSLLCFVLLDVLSKLKANDWKLLRVQRDQMVNPDNLALVIINDDIEMMDSLPDFDPNSVISHSPYETCQFLKCKVPLVCYAAFFCASKCLDRLVKSGADMTVRDQRGYSIFHYAVAGGNTELIKTLKPEVNALNIAAEFHRKLVFQYLHNTLNISYGEVDSVNNTILHYCAKSNNLDVALMVIGEISVNLKNSSNQTPLMIASHYNSKEVIELLISRKEIDINMVDSFGQTALHYAAIQNNVDAIKMLINDPGLDASIRDTTGKTAFGLAVTRNRLDSAKILSNLYKDDELDEEGRSIVHLAILTGDIEMVKFVHSAGFDINSLDGNGVAPLLFAIQQNRIDIAKFLLSLPEVDHTAKTSFGLTPLHIAVGTKNMELIQMLKTDPNIQDIDGMTPLLMAVFSARLDCAQYLVEKSDTSIAAIDGQTIVHFAVRSGSIKMLNFVIGLGLDINMQSNYGDTPLMIAATQGKVEMIRALNKADPNLQNKFGKTALHLACENGNDECIEALMEIPSINPDIEDIYGQKAQLVHD